MKTVLINYIHPDYPSDDCVYCGELASTRDHLLPRNFTGNADRLRVPVVPACNECNSTLNQVHIPDVMERREYLQNKYRTKYKSFLKVIWYGEVDLLEFGPQLRYMILKRMSQHITVMARLSWPRNPTYDADAWAGAWEEEQSLDPDDLPSPLRGLKFDSRGI